MGMGIILSLFCFIMSTQQSCLGWGSVKLLVFNRRTPRSGSECEARAWMQGLFQCCVTLLGQEHTKLGWSGLIHCTIHYERLCQPGYCPEHVSYSWVRASSFFSFSFLLLIKQVVESSDMTISMQDHLWFYKSANVSTVIARTKMAILDGSNRPQH